jgi:hypothetical protein
MPKFWSFIGRELVSNHIRLLDMVYDEINVGNDELSNWLSNITPLEPVNHRNQEIINNYSNILNYVQTSGLYKSEALTGWSGITIADPWLIATAMLYNYTIITFENPNSGLNVKQPVKKVKIPDICKEFNVRCESLYYMMKKLSFKG